MGDTREAVLERVRLDHGGAQAPAITRPAESARDLITWRDSLFRRSLAAADALAVGASLLVSVAAIGDGLRPAAVLAPLVVILLAKSIGLYERDQHLLHRTTLDEFPGLFGLASVTVLLFWLADGLVVSGPLDRGQVILAWALLVVLLILLRVVTRALAGRMAPVERCLFIGDQRAAAEFGEKLETSGSVHAVLVGWLPFTHRRSTDPAEAPRMILDQAREFVDERQVQRVIVGAGVPEEMLDELRRSRTGIKVSVLPQMARVVQSSAEIDRLNGVTLLGLRPIEITGSSRFVKRGFDLAGSVLALCLLAPLMSLIAVAIKLDSKGPVLFRHIRAGRHGKRFEMLKFRSMVHGAEDLKEALRDRNEADGIFKIADDPRITRVGKWIRRAHLDELPQLVNVLRGEMSLVGPRPLPLDEDARIEGWHRRRLDLRPGITGPWQVLGSAQIPMREMLKLDYQYVANWSPWNDVRILLLTVPRVVGRRGM